ncbi:MAG: hypothetical protein JOS17DRAFT_738294 [Linnemannia elongata]|nr:MAG: hypothetical protein JOS17DRAFT_738294 [Linnemannia elongata]
MSAVSLSRRRKADLKELASSLGLSEDGVREDIVERIKAHIATSNDPSLRALIRDDSPDTTTTTTTTTYTTKDNSGRASPRKKTTVVTKESRSSSAGARRGSHSHSHTEDEELEEREVRGFMEHMQGELHEAKDLAKQLEDTLHAKFTTGNSSHGKSTLTSSGSSGGKGNSSHNSTSLNSGGRRGSKDQSSYSRHDSGHSSSLQHQESEQSSSHLLRSRRLHHDDDEDDEEEGGRHRHSKHHHKHHHHHHHHHGPGWGTQVIRALKNHVVDNFCQYTPKPWRWLQDLGSTSRGFVWLTLLLELTVFLSQAYAHHKSTSGGSCLGFLTNWPNFLQPFFSYYGTFFLLPTLLSQLFNVDTSRPSASTSSNKQSLTGLLSKHTTSGLSYFVFKFALTYFLGHSIGFKSLLGTALPAGAKMWSGCKYISDIFRYVPQALGLATSGAGTVLALAESIVQSNHHRR